MIDYILRKEIVLMRMRRRAGLRLFIMATANVEVLYDAQARLGEGPCYDHVTEELIFVDILAKSVNFLSVETQQIRYYVDSFAGL